MYHCKLEVKLMVMGLVPFFLLMVFVIPTSAEYELSNTKISLPSRSSQSARTKNYAVIFDAGSSGSRVHVYCFDQDLALLAVGNGTDLELFVQIKPGLSAYAKDPQAAAETLLPLLQKAENAVPKESRPKAPVRVGATAGLRSLEGNASERILQAVRDLLKHRSTLKSGADSVSLLDGSQEGSYMWMTINYLVGNLGKRYSDTVGIVDLGGGSVQMAYAISEANAANAPKVSHGEDPYIKELLLKGTKYYLYVHSYLNYGLRAARAEILKVSKGSTNPCILFGYNGSYSYGGKDYKALASPSGSSLEGCRRVVLKALKIKAPCKSLNCTFGGVWNGGGGAGQKNLYVASFFFDKASEVGIVDPNVHVGKASPADFKNAAKRACATKFKEARSKYPTVEMSELPFICMDFVYEYTLLVDGFGVSPGKNFTLVKQLKYRDSLLEAAWPLGSAIDAVSSLASL